MTEGKGSTPAGRRVRASERALRIALKVIQDAGLPVDKVCISGGEIEIHCAPIAAKIASPDNGGLKDW